MNVAHSGLLYRLVEHHGAAVFQAPSGHFVDGLLIGKSRNCPPLFGFE